MNQKLKWEEGVLHPAMRVLTSCLVDSDKCFSSKNHSYVRKYISNSFCLQLRKQRFREAESLVPDHTVPCVETGHLPLANRLGVYNVSQKRSRSKGLRGSNPVGWGCVQWTNLGALFLWWIHWCHSHCRLIEKAWDRRLQMCAPKFLQGWPSSLWSVDSPPNILNSSLVPW